MKTKKVLSIVLSTGFLLGTFPVLATSTNTETEGRVRFIADPDGGGEADIQHPEHAGEAPIWITPLPPAGEGLYPGGAGSAGIAGPLRLNFVPNFYFGTQVISDENKTYHAYFLRAGEHETLMPTLTEIEEIPHFVQVTDARGTLGGWTLTVQNTPFEASLVGTALQNSYGAATHVLSGATIEFVDANHNTYTEWQTGINVHETPIVLNGTGEAGSEIVMSSPSGRGTGIHQAVWGSHTDASPAYNTAVRLHVPGTTTQLAGVDYTTELTWTLTDGPTN